MERGQPMVISYFLRRRVRFLFLRFYFSSQWPVSYSDSETWVDGDAKSLFFMMCSWRDPVNFYLLHLVEAEQPRSV